VRTWAPRGQTPVLQLHFNWHQLSAIAGLTFWNFYFKFVPGAVRGPQVVEFLKQLRAQLKRKLLIIWDGRPAHRSRLVRDYIDSTNGTLQIEQLPAYAPELNPVEFRGRTGSSTSWRISARKISPNSRIRS
jgi:DDE superfamily endonuclease